MISQISTRYRKILFHILLWNLWLYLSVAYVPDAELHDKAILIAKLIIFNHIPLFLINTEWLIPRVLEKQGVRAYSWSLVALTTLFGLYHLGLLNFMASSVAESHAHEGMRLPKGFFAIILVSAISTGYGLLSFVADHEKRQQAKEQERLRSELSFLRSQISPHFIFNILNSIVYLVRSNSQLAESATIKLSELLRYMLYDSDDMQISVEKEVYYLKNYIELQQIRFEEDVAIRFEVQGEAPRQTIEPMLLFPFVENAFKHGVGLIDHPEIAILLELQSAGLSFIVKNKMPANSAKSTGGDSGIGLKNVTRRLELLYPHKHKLNVTAKDNWFVAHLDLSF